MELGVNQGSQAWLPGVNRFAQIENSRGKFGIARDQILKTLIMGDSEEVSRSEKLNNFLYLQSVNNDQH
jgi:hypothetical protein